MKAYPNSHRRTYGALTVMESYPSGMMVGDPFAAARPNGFAQAGMMVPLGVGGVAGLGIARILGAGWPGAIGAGVVGMALMFPIALFGGFAGAIADWGTSTADKTAYVPPSTPTTQVAWTPSAAVQQGAAAAAQLLSKEAKPNVVRIGPRAKSNISGAVVGLISTGVQAAGGIAGQAVAGAYGTAGVRAQTQLTAQQAELAATQALAQQAGATAAGEASTKQTMIIAGAGVIGLMAIGGLGLVLYRMNR
jgi:hypothetical protein